MSLSCTPSLSGWTVGVGGRRVEFGHSGIDRDAQLWRYDMETMKLENRLLLRTGKEWEFQDYKWTLPDVGNSGEVEGAVVKFEKNI